MFLSFSNIHLEVNVINLLETEAELRKILISVFFAFSTDDNFKNGLGAAGYHQIDILVILSCYKDIYIYIYIYQS